MINFIKSVSLNWFCLGGHIILLIGGVRSESTINILFNICFISWNIYQLSIKTKKEKYGSWDHLVAEECKLKNTKTVTRSTRGRVPFHPVNILNTEETVLMTKDSFTSNGTGANLRREDYERIELERKNLIKKRQQEEGEEAKQNTGYKSVLGVSSSKSLAEDYAIGTITGLF